MQLIATPHSLKVAADYLTNQDPVLADIISKFGSCNIKPHQDYYKALVDSIIGQQLSVKAASSIRRRFYELFVDESPLPEDILAKSAEAYRAIGLSYRKAQYIQDLALHIIEGRLIFDTIEDLTNEKVINLLTNVKGVGEWTAHMFLIFSMGRLDVLPVGDLGIKNGIKQLYNFDKLPSPDQVRETAVKFNWHPYESVASWYVWRSLDNEPK